MKPPEELEQCIEKNVKSQSKEAELIISATVVKVRKPRKTLSSLSVHLRKNCSMYAAIHPSAGEARSSQVEMPHLFWQLSAATEGEWASHATCESNSKLTFPSDNSRSAAFNSTTLKRWPICFESTTSHLKRVTTRMDCMLFIAEIWIFVAFL